MAKLSEESIYRILDVNINRLTEGIRVCEEIVRFILNDRNLTSQFRNMRHGIARVACIIGRDKLIQKRSSQQDVGRILFRGELKRAGYQDIFFANIQRAKESLRVLEEFYKLIDRKAAIRLKKIRYRVYELEKKVTLRFCALSGIRQRFLPQG